MFKSILTLTVALSATLLAAQDQSKPISVTALFDNVSAIKFFTAKAKISSTKIVKDKFDNVRSIATISIQGKLEGNLCGDNRVSLTSKVSGFDYNTPYAKQNIELALVSFKQHYGRQPMAIASNLGPALFCLAYSKTSVYNVRTAFTGHLSEDGTTGKSAVFNVILRNRKDKPSYKFRVTFNGKTKQWRLKQM